jgi:hypothetical protein
MTGIMKKRKGKERKEKKGKGEKKAKKGRKKNERKRKERKRKKKERTTKNNISKRSNLHIVLAYIRTIRTVLSAFFPAQLDGLSLLSCEIAPPLKTASKDSTSAKDGMGKSMHEL